MGTRKLTVEDFLSVSSNGSTWVKQRLPARRLLPHTTFSILERIDVGETSRSGLSAEEIKQTFSILERIDVGETYAGRCSNLTRTPFSILERIDVGETGGDNGDTLGRKHLSVSSNGSTWVKHASRVACAHRSWSSFSILERIDVGETAVSLQEMQRLLAFSILERIDVGETMRLARHWPTHGNFQYPRTDRRG